MIKSEFPKTFVAQNLSDRFVLGLEKVSRMKVHTDTAAVVNRFKDPNSLHVYFEIMSCATYKYIQLCSLTPQY